MKAEVADFVARMGKKNCIWVLVQTPGGETALKIWT